MTDTDWPDGHLPEADDGPELVVTDPTDVEIVVDDEDAADLPVATADEDETGDEEVTA